MIAVAVAAIIVIALGAAVFVMGGNDKSGSDSGSTDDSGSGSGDDSGTDTGTTEVTTVDGLTVTYESGTDGIVKYAKSSSTGEYTVTFGNVAADTEYTVSGTLNGGIVVDAGDYAFTLNLAGVTITSSNQVPIYIASGDSVSISAKSGTTNSVTDSRAEQTSDEDISAAVYSMCDLEIKGKGTLEVTSANNNGIHSKDDLEVQNLTLTVTCVDNALKGNDSVTIKSGTVKLTASSGDGIKTTNSDVSSKGNQRGTVTINSDKGDTSVLIYAYYDGIDAAYDVVVQETEGNTVTLKILTYTYASNVTAFGWGVRPGQQGGGIDSEGNPNSIDYSAKGIKAANTITVSGGDVYIKAYDDAIHANADTLENGSTGTGDVTVSGGVLTLYSMDDAIHADGTVVVSGGTVDVTNGYEGLEGERIVVSGGSVSVVSTDDGFNATATTGVGIEISDGYIYVLAGGDGLDSNSRTSYAGIVFSGGEVVVISTSNGNSVLDTDAGYSYNGGRVLAICPSGGMWNESIKCSGFNNVGKYASGSLSKDQVLTVSVGGSLSVALKMPVSLSSVVIYLGSNSPTFGTSSSSSVSFDANGVYWS